MSDELFWLIVEMLVVIRLCVLIETLSKRKIAEDEMIFRLKIWLIERGRNG